MEEKENEKEDNKHSKRIVKKTKIVAEKKKGRTKDLQKGIVTRRRKRWRRRRRRRRTRTTDLHTNR